MTTDLPASEIRAVVPHDHTFAKSIENYIDVRDELWINLTFSAEISEHDLGVLATANQALGLMLNCPDGPNTRGLEPARARRECLRLKICETFIAHVALEILERKQTAQQPVLTAAYRYLANQGDDGISQPAARVG